MTEEELRVLKVNKSVDARGTSCPGPLLAAKKAIGQIQKDEIMEVLSADEGTRNDIPKWAKKKQYDYLGCVEEDGYYKLYLKK